ncbi:PucR family transcriptional regulator [Eubacterium oxidoreducens]|uniref:PucR C-terminal helix-turn-helix domain-containing protein n=1 Tax=Eubacterium oxidoreducens TaxID=1732 RepID=A0A1G6C1Y5_EUBOX|nr:helix-turn-helix domain-containing protein [Eubacterium oxidoreducens]SDB26865.1 PucR C-terminal helix-turn-helix domain-containing protein [Eubacterium oxidoreducens]
MKNNFSITLQILLSELDISLENEIPDRETPSFVGFTLYTSTIVLSSDKIVLGALTDILPIAKSNPDIFFLCIRDRYHDEHEPDELASHVLILKTNAGLADIINKVSVIFDRHRSWQTAMALSVSREKGLQDLMDISEHILDNHVDILDSTFKLLAYTKHLVSDDPTTQSLIEHGYHNEETIEKFRKYRRLEQFATQTGLILSDDYLMTQYETVKKIFHVGGHPSIYVIMQCNRYKPDAYRLDIFDIFLHYVEYYAKTDRFHRFSSAASKQYILDLLENNIRTQDEAITRSSNAGLPFQQQYILHQIGFDDVFNIPWDNLTQRIQDALPFSYVLQYNRKIVILHNQSNQTDHLITVHSVLNQALQKYPCLVGTSNIFHNLWEIKAAYDQANCAIEHGAHVRQIKETDYTPVSYYTFEESFLTLLVAKSFHSSPNIFQNSFMFCAIRLLLDYDRKHNSNLLKLLETYLKCNRKATDTSEKLHMHRNTVLYHMERIEKLLDVSLNDSEVCLKLQLGIEAYTCNMIEIHF